MGPPVPSGHPYVVELLRKYRLPQSHQYASQADWDLSPEPTQTAGSNWMDSCVITGHLFAALLRTAEFWSGDHALLVGEGRDDIFQRHAAAAEMALEDSWSTTST